MIRKYTFLLLALILLVTVRNVLSDSNNISKDKKSEMKPSHFFSEKELIEAIQLSKQTQNYFQRPK